MSRVFISYARESEPVAERVDDRLRALGYEVWRDNQLPAHRPYGEVLEERLREADAVVVLWSKEAVGSQWVRGEADVARNAGRLVQARLDDSLPPLPFNQIQCADLRGWNGRAETAGWLKLVASVATLAPLDASPEAKTAPIAAPSAQRPRWLWAFGVAAALVVAVVSAWFLLGRSGSADAGSPGRIAVLPFDATGSGPDAQRFATGLSDEILSVLSAQQAQAVSRTESAGLHATDSAAIKRLGAALLIDGTVEETAGRMRVRVHLDDAVTRTILWSEDFERPASELEPLQAEVAAKAANLSAYAQNAWPSRIPDAALADYLSGLERIRFDWSGGTQSAEPIFRRVVQQAPRFAGGHSELAVALSMERGSPGAQPAALAAEAAREAQRALALDRRGFAAYAVLAWLKSPTDWAGREAEYRKGMAADATEAAYPYLLGNDLWLRGQLNAALTLERRAVAMDPLWPGPNWGLGLAELDTGHQSEGLATFDRMAELWPRHDAARAGRFWATAVYGDPDKALALLADQRTTPAGVSPGGLVLWREFLTAVKSSAPPSERARAAAALEAGEKAGVLSSGPATVMLARLGDLDGAFAAANDYLSGVNTQDIVGAPYLFVSATAPMRRDPRFWPLMAKSGLPQFWLSSGQWPDFCAEPGLPYDCKVEAAKVSMPAKR